MTRPDPAVQAVTADVRRHLAGYLSDAEIIRVVGLVVDAYRRQVLASRPDAERLQLIRGWVGAGHAGPAAETTRYLLAALADETAARQAAEADLADWLP